MTEKKQHPHAEFLRAIADGDPMDDWDCRHATWLGRWQSTTHARIESIIANPDDWKVRRKQKTIRIGAMDVPEPMRVAPAKGTEYWLVSPTDTAVWSYSWGGDSADHQWFGSGLCHATKEAAEAHRRALILVSGGTP